jgi:hypothetical protein
MRNKAAVSKEKLKAELQIKQINRDRLRRNLRMNIEERG